MTKPNSVGYAVYVHPNEDIAAWTEPSSGAFVSRMLSKGNQSGESLADVPTWMMPKSEDAANLTPEPIHSLPNLGKGHSKTPQAATITTLPKVKQHS